ncbi:hypothetical protein CR29_26945 [Salmonella enterica subsp. enterica]|jgi:hypothetical protein|nr:hypothetical protein [Salmonella enterica subsp. enterica]
MGYHERTYTGRQTSKYSEKPTRQSRFFHIWRKRLMLKAFDLNADLPSLAILHKKASRMGGFFVSGVRVEQCDSIFQFALSAITLN